MSAVPRGLVISVAATAVLAIAANSASADFTPAGTAGHSVTAVTTQRFQLDANHYWQCTGLSGSAAISGDGATLSFVPTYTGCQGIWAGTHPVVVSTPGQWIYRGTATQGVVDTGGELSFRYGSCTVFVDRAVNATVSYTNVGSNLQISSTATGLPYRSTGCAAFGYGSTGRTFAMTWTVSVAGANAVTPPRILNVASGPLSLACDRRMDGCYLTWASGAWSYAET